MLLLLLRVLLSGAFVWLLWSASTEASANLSADVVNAGRFALAIVVGFGAALTWAPVLGEEIAGPVTGLMSDGNVAQINFRLVRWAKHCQTRGWRRLALLLAFVEGVRRPNLPAAFAIGLRCARPGSWLELAFAREVWRFNNVANCVRAFDILVLHHDRRPRAHPVPEVNLALLAHTRPVPSPAEVLPVPSAPPPPPLERNERIRLFAGAPRGGTTPEPAAESEPDTTS
jgi:hypothetical protein